MTDTSKPIRPFETRYFDHLTRKKPLTRGFPKAENGSIEGAAKAVAKGYVRKVQCVDRWHNDTVIWTVKAGKRVPGVHIIPVLVEKGEGRE